MTPSAIYTKGFYSSPVNGKQCEVLFLYFPPKPNTGIYLSIS